MLQSFSFSSFRSWRLLPPLISPLLFFSLLAIVSLPEVASAQCASPPVVTRVVSSYGEFGIGQSAVGGSGSDMIIYGRNFTPSTQVLINSDAQEVTYISGSELRFRVGKGSDGFIFVCESFCCDKFPFVYLPGIPPPSVFSFFPPTVPCGRTSRVYIVGAAFFPGVTASIGGQPVRILERIQTADFTVNPPVARDTIIVENTSGLTGLISVTSTDPLTGRRSGTSPTSLQCTVPTQDAPVITRFSPSEGGPDTEITIEGQNLTNISGIRIGRAPASILSTNPLKVKPGDQGRTGTIEIFTPGGTAVSSTEFTFIGRPVITSVSPLIIGPGTPVYIRGQNLLRGSVNFGGVVPVNLEVRGDTLMIATIGTIGTIQVRYPQLELSLSIDNIPINVSGRGGTTIAPDRAVFVKEQYVRPSVSLKVVPTSVGARLDETGRTLTLNERRATFYPPEDVQTGNILLVRQNWNVGVNVAFRVSYVDAANQPLTFERGLSIDLSRTQQLPLPIPPYNVAQLPYFPKRELANINGLWADLNPTRLTAARDSLRLGENIIPIPGVRSLLGGNPPPDTARISLRARWSDQLYLNNPERIRVEDILTPIGRQGKRRMVVELITAPDGKTSPDGQYDIDPAFSRATVILDDPELARPQLINPVADRLLAAGASDSIPIEFPVNIGLVDVKPTPNGGVLPKDIFYDDNYLPLTYTVRSSDTTILLTSLERYPASTGNRPFVRFRLLPTALSGSSAEVIITATSTGGTTTHRFTVRVQQGAPVITSVNPEAGRPGSTVTITGRDFGTNPRVSFANASGGRLDITPSASTDTLITVQVPNGAETGKINVANAIATGTSPNDFMIIRTPQITSFTPDSAPQGTTITIRGTNFLGANRVSFGGVAAGNFQILSDTVITAVVQSGGASGLIQIANLLDSGRSANPFTFFPPPSLQNFSPVISGAGSTLTLTGLNFSGVGFSGPSSVQIGGRDASFAVLSPTQMTATVPDFGMNTMNNLTLTVVTRGGSTTASIRFTFTPCPSIDAFAPASGSAQTVLSIIGTGLQAVTGVTVGGVPVRSFSLASPTKIVAIIGSVESGDVQIIAGNCIITAAGRFTYQAPSRPLLIQPATFTRIFPGDTQQGLLTVTNQSASVLNFTLALNSNDGSFSLPAPSTLTLRRNETMQVPITFSPRSSGRKSAVISATPQGASASIDTLQTAQAGVWEITAVNFDTVRTGRSTLRSALVTNRDTSAAQISSVLLQSDGAFRVAGTSPNWIAKGETAAIILRCQPSVTQQRLQTALTVIGASDTATAPITAFSRTPQVSDIALEARFTPERDNIPPGQNVALRMEITGGQNLDRLGGSNAQWRGSARWSQTTLLSTLNKNATQPTAQGQFTLVRNSDNRNPFQRIAFPAQSLTLPASVPPVVAVASIPSGVYLGKDSVSVLEFEEMSVTLIGSTQRVFVEESQVGSAFGRFTAQTGGRLIQRANSTPALTVISPNPAQNLVAVKLTLPTETAIVLSLVDARGILLKTLAEGWFQSGEHSVEFDASAIPSGSYMILLHTERESLSRPVQFIR